MNDGEKPKKEYRVLLVAADHAMVEVSTHLAHQMLVEVIRVPLRVVCDEPITPPILPKFIVGLTSVHEPGPVRPKKRFSPPEVRGQWWNRGSR